MINDTAKIKLGATMNIIDGAYAPSTIRAYSKNFERFIEYCHLNNLCALPSEPEVVASYIEYLSKNKLKSSSIRLAIASIASIHQLNLLKDPKAHPIVKIELKRMHRNLGRASKQAYGITLTTLNQLLKTLDDSIIGIRNPAILMTAYDSMCRRSELTSLRIEDCIIDWDSRRIKAKLRKSKSDQDGIGRMLFLSEETQEALISWIEIVSESSGYIFRSIRRDNSIGSSLTAAHINRIYKALAIKANLDKNIVKSISGHSMRVGAAQDLLTSGASMPIIMNRGRWTKTDTVMKYLEQASY